MNQLIHCKLQRPARLHLLLVVLAIGGGCNDAPVPSSAIRSDQTSSSAEPVQPAKAQPEVPGASDVQVLREYWDLQKLGGERIGHSQTIVGKVHEDGEDLLRTTSISESRLQRLGQTIQQQVRLASWERLSGELVRFETKITGGGGDAHFTGHVKDNSLTIVQITAGKRTSQQIAWRPTWGGFFAPEESLRKQPMAPGEARTITALLPILHQPGEIRLVAEKEKETVALPTGEQRLLKIHVAMHLLGNEKPVLEADQWIDDQGETQRSFLTGLNQETLRVSKAEALAREDRAPVDVILTTSIPLKEPIEDAHQTKRVRYRAHVKSGKIAGLLVECASQHIKPIDETTAEVEVIALRPDSDLTSDSPRHEPTDADLAPNNLVQSDDAAVIALSKQAAPDETDPWKVAIALEKFVKRKVASKNFSQAMATAAEVATNLEGDCTEHAVLLAGLLRARKIPARVAMGLVYFPPQHGFAYHMWTEAWIKDRWIPLDGTLGLGGIGGGHLKLADSNLADSYASFLTVMQAMGRLELEVEDVTH